MCFVAGKSPVDIYGFEGFCSSVLPPQAVCGSVQVLSALLLWIHSVSPTGLYLIDAAGSTVEREFLLGFRNGGPIL